MGGDGVGGGKGRSLIKLRLNLRGDLLPVCEEVKRIETLDKLEVKTTTLYGHIKYNRVITQTKLLALPRNLTSMSIPYYENSCRVFPTVIKFL